jgi:hypothetical protein
MPAGGVFRKALSIRAIPAMAFPPPRPAFRPETEGETGRSAEFPEPPERMPLRVLLVIAGDAGVDVRLRECLAEMTAFTAEMEQASTSEAVRTALAARSFDVALIDFRLNETTRRRLLDPRLEGDVPCGFGEQGAVPRFVCLSRRVPAGSLDNLS